MGCRPRGALELAAGRLEEVLMVGLGSEKAV